MTSWGRGVYTQHWHGGFDYQGDGQIVFGCLDKLPHASRPILKLPPFNSFLHLPNGRRRSRPEGGVDRTLSFIRRKRYLGIQEYQVPLIPQLIYLRRVGRLLFLVTNFTSDSHRRVNESRVIHSNTLSDSHVIHFTTMSDSLDCEVSP